MLDCLLSGVSLRIRNLPWVFPLLISLPAFCQHDYVGRFDVYGGFMYLESPHINLAERGFHLQAGLRPTRWYSLGFDYSISTGHTTLTPDLLTTSLQQSLGAQLARLIAAGVIPPTYALTVPIDSTTATFAAGPQFAWRHWPLVTLYIRPSIGAIHETATPHALDPVAAAIIAQFAPSGEKKDWTPFYGVGGGFDVNFSKYTSIRVQVDFVHDHLFSDLLKDGRNSVRLSVGPALQFGHNVGR